MVDMDADRLQLLLEQVGRWLSGVAGDDHAADVQSLFLIDINQTDNILIVGDAKIMADLIALDIGSIDRYDHLCLIGKLKKHLQLTVRGKARKYAGCMIVIK